MAGSFLLVVLSLGVAGYALVGYGLLPPGELVHPDMKAAFASDAAAIRLHAFAAALALILGPFQFSVRLRSVRPRLHRWLGRIYLGIGVLAGGLAGLWIAQYAHGGPVARVGFAVLALCWLYTGYRAWDAIRHRRVEEHRQWMVRNFSLTFAAVTLRLYIPLILLFGVEFAVGYAMIAWLCWVPNLVVAQWLIRRSVSRPPA